MDGPGIIKLTLEIIPKLVNDVLRKANLKDSDIALYLMHQATVKLLSELRQQLKVSEDRFPLALKDCGNTVSSTIPILINELRTSGRVRAGTKTLMAGFGVGFSWAGCVWTDTWQNHAVKPAEEADAAGKDADSEAA